MLSASVFPSLLVYAREESALGKNNMEYLVKTVFLNVGIRDDKHFLGLI